jgi:hypothetical protein
MDNYFITSYGDGYAIVNRQVQQMFVERNLMKEVCDGRARLYVVFPFAPQLNITSATDDFVFYHNDGHILSMKSIVCTIDREDEIEPIPLTLVRQTTDPLVSEIHYVNQLQQSQLDRIEMLAQIASEEINRINPTNKVQKRIADLVIKDAVKQELICPITMNPLTLSSATCVSPCYHIFEKDAITRWLETKNTCPECREQCCV